MFEERQSAHQYSIKMGKVLLIDLENCSEQIHYLQENLEDFSQVVICYAQTHAKIPLDWLIPLSTAVSSNRLTILKMARGGKNSADFGICFFAGVLMQKLPEETHFVIISNDTDLDHTVNLLQSQGRSAERIGTRKEEKDTTTNTTKPSSESADISRVKLYCEYLIKNSKNRPTKPDTLLNSIKTQFKESREAATEVLNVLRIQGMVTIAEGKVSYHDKKIQELLGKS